MMVVLRLGAMHTQYSHSFGEFVIVGNHHAPVAVRTEIFGGKEAEAAEIPDRSHLTPSVLGTNRLCRVFDDIEVVLFGNFHDLVHIGRLTIEVDGDDCLNN